MRMDRKNIDCRKFLEQGLSSMALGSVALMSATAHAEEKAPDVPMRGPWDVTALEAP